MDQDNPLKAPLMMLAIVLIVSGAGLVLMFGYATWQMLYHPENVEGLKYLFSKTVVGSEAPPFSVEHNGQVSKIEMNDGVKMYFTIFIGIMAFRALMGVGSALTGTGVMILRAVDFTGAKKTRSPGDPVIPL